MEGFDLRLLLTLGTCFATVVSAAAIARFQLKNLVDKAAQLQHSIGMLDQRLDKSEQNISLLQSKLAVIVSMNDPDKMERHWRELTSIGKDIEWLKENVKGMKNAASR